MTSILSVRTVRERSVEAARAVARVALHGLPAMRAALHGARVGAGAAFAPAVVERLGLKVMPSSTRAIGHAVSQATAEAALVLRRGDAVLRAGARELLVHTPDGLTLRVTPGGGAVASVSQDTIRAIARTTTRGALAGIGRAALGGAAAGAALDGVLAGAWALRGMRAGAITRGDALRHVGKHAARGAFTGAVGVAAAGAVSFGMAATGFAIVGAPVVVPIATMVTASALAARLFNRVFGA